MIATAKLQLLAIFPVVAGNRHHRTPAALPGRHQPQGSRP